MSLLKFSRTPHKFFKTIMSRDPSLTNDYCFKRWLQRRHSNPKLVEQQSHSVHILPASENNYMYMVVDALTKETVVIDAIDPEQVENVIKSQQLILKAILTTHHLPDHAGGNNTMRGLYPQVPIYGGDKRVLAVNKLAKNGDMIKFGTLRIKCLFEPKRTSGHVCYFLRAQDSKEYPSAFVGDTLFVGGAGEFPESNIREMYAALHDVIAVLPDHTMIFCGHENTVENLKFAASIDRVNKNIKERLAWAENLRGKKEPTVPSLIMEEKRYNPYLRIKQSSLQKQCQTASALDTLTFLRKKNLDWKKA